MASSPSRIRLNPATRTERKKKQPVRLLLSIWAHLDLNQGPTGYESAALTAEL